MTSVTIREFEPEKIPDSCTMIIIAPPATGKCEAAGTRLLMYDGSVKVIEDIQVGELLMGDDSQPREVLSTCSGADEMYRIDPISYQADSYTVNSAHILCLKRHYKPTISKYHDEFKVKWMKDNNEHSKRCKTQESAQEYLQTLLNTNDYSECNHLEISVKDFLESSKTTQEKYKGYHVGVEFSSKPVLISPWILGYWLGDGSSATSEITTIDEEIISAFKTFCDAESLEFHERKGITHRVCGKTWRTNTFLDNLKTYNLINNKHIPQAYLINDRKTRLELLAGLLDSDGHYAAATYFEITQKNEILADNIVFLARSLGFAVSKREVQKTCTNSSRGRIIGTYFRMNISGNIDEIPTIVKRKQAHSVARRSHHDVYGIRITPVGRGKYHGFQLSGNGRYLHADFTVTHNTSLMENFCYANRHRYPVARVFIGVEDNYKRYCNIFGNLFVSNVYQETDERKHILRQKTLKMEGHTVGHAINIIDDALEDAAAFRTPTIKSLFKQGSQHFNQLLMIGTQYAVDFPPDIRANASYVILGRNPDVGQRRLLYDNFGGICGEFKDFCKLMDNLTGDYTFMVINKRASSNNLEDCVFWYRTKPLPLWQFGCKEMREWNKKRYNTDYAEEINV